MSDIRYIDVHSHLNLEQFEGDWEAVLNATLNAGVGCITVGVDVASSKRAIEISSIKHEGVWATVGIHPNRVMDADQAGLDSISRLAGDAHVVAIGECGFDFFRSGEEVWARQREVFEAQVEIAKAAKKPLMLHIRSGEKGGGKSAYQEALGVLRQHPDVVGNVHFFAGTYEDAKGFFNIGYSVSFTGVITFARDYDETVKNAPLSMLHAETDAPYAAPVPHRGKRNESQYVIEVIKKIAELRDQPLEEVARELRKNAAAFFGI